MELVCQPEDVDIDLPEEGNWLLWTLWGDSSDISRLIGNLHRHIASALIPVLDADFQTLALEPAFQINGRAAAITGSSDRLTVAMISNIASSKDSGDIGHRVLNRDDITCRIH